MEKSFLWIKSAIGTCITEFHIDCCKSLIKLFTDKYKDEPDFYKYYGELIDEVAAKETFLSVLS